ncbi:MAG: hypothetical protein Q8R30_05360 [bacterium]|nr:hypothetical protein [bacterium]
MKIPREQTVLCSYVVPSPNLSFPRHAGGRSAFGGKAGIQTLLYEKETWIPAFLAPP